MRKGSTASLSHIEGALNQSTPPVGLRANSSSHNLTHSVAAADTWYSDGDHPMNVGSAAGDGVTSPVSTTSTKSTGKFFVFGGTRSARKQRQVCDCVPIVRPAVLLSHGAVSFLFTAIFTLTLLMRLSLLAVNHSVVLLP